jgi:hypothetical protein
MSSLIQTKLFSIIENLNQDIKEYTTFIETGTLVGDTVVGLSSVFNTLHTIELSEKYYNLSTKRIKNEGFKNIKTHLGDSVNVLPTVLETITEQNNCIFWLDGHWSSGDTGKGEKDCPLIEECTIINDLYLPNKAVVLIDDYRLFGTNLDQDWSQITSDRINRCFTNFKIQKQFVFDDVLSFTVEK